MLGTKKRSIFVYSSLADSLTAIDDYPELKGLFYTGLEDASSRREFITLLRVIGLQLQGDVPGVLYNLKIQIAKIKSTNLRWKKIRMFNSVNKLRTSWDNFEIKNQRALAFIAVSTELMGRTDVASTKENFKIMYTKHFLNSFLRKELSDKIKEVGKYKTEFEEIKMEIQRL